MASPVSRVVRKKVGTDVDAPLPASSTRDWSELPPDAIVSIFGKLDAIEILMGVGLVCRSWLAATKLPDLWRSMDMTHHNFVDEYHLAEPKINGDVLRAMARVAVDRSGRQMEEFVVSQFVNDELLDYIGDRSPALKTLGLMSNYGVINIGFTHFIAKCPMLEDLKLDHCNYVFGRDMYESMGMASPRLKHFTLRKADGFSLMEGSSSGEALGFAAMHELRSLTLSNSDVTSDELPAILDGCPHLELLDLRDCFNIVDNNVLRARCVAIKSLMVPYDYATM